MLRFFLHGPRASGKSALIKLLKPENTLRLNAEQIELRDWRKFWVRFMNDKEVGITDFSVYTVVIDHFHQAQPDLVLELIKQLHMGFLHKLNIILISQEPMPDRYPYLREHFAEVEFKGFLKLATSH